MCALPTSLPKGAGCNKGGSWGEPATSRLVRLSPGGGCRSPLPPHSGDLVAKPVRRDHPVDGADDVAGIGSKGRDGLMAAAVLNHSTFVVLKREDLVSEAQPAGSHFEGTANE